MMGDVHGASTAVTNTLQLKSYGDRPCPRSLPNNIAWTSFRHLRREASFDSGDSIRYVEREEAGHARVAIPSPEEFYDVRVWSADRLDNL